MLSTFDDIRLSGVGEGGGGWWWGLLLSLQDVVVYVEQPA